MECSVGPAACPPQVGVWWELHSGISKRTLIKCIFCPFGHHLCKGCSMLITSVVQTTRRCWRILAAPSSGRKRGKAVEITGCCDAHVVCPP